jgi:hypothetical protein
MFRVFKHERNLKINGSVSTVLLILNSVLETLYVMSTRTYLAVVGG